MKRPREEGGVVDANLAALLMLLSGTAAGAAAPELPAGRVFECRTCNRQFPSFQALGGHRASHKKPRAAEGDTPAPLRPAKPRVHECSICGLEFSLGQALGGHMRRHRAELEASAVRLGPPEEAKPREEEEETSGLTLDLNAPAPPESDPMLALCLELPLVHLRRLT